jgi:spore maturation protein CgeB
MQLVAGSPEPALNRLRGARAEAPWKRRGLVHRAAMVGERLARSRRVRSAAVRILIVDTYYPAFVDAHYRARPGLDRRPYAEQVDSLMARRFGTFDAYSHNLRSLGHEAAEVVANCEPLQRAWAREERSGRLGAALSRLAPGRYGARARRAALRSVLRAQVERFRPDVVYLQDMGFHATAEVEAFRTGGRLVAGQIASPAPPDSHLRAFDLIVTSFPHFVNRFQRLGVESEYLPLAFDPRLHDDLRAEGIDPTPAGERPHAVSFVGGLDPRVHAAGTALLEQVAARAPVEFWGYGASGLAPDSAIRRRYHGEAWGLDMYRVLARSRIVVNRHIDAAKGHANNMRLFEATGGGALLLTDRGRNLGELFQPGSEVAVYDDADDLAAKLRHYLEHDDERRAIAAAGQARTLRDHSYARRMEQLAELLEERLKRRSARRW